MERERNGFTGSGSRREVLYVQEKNSHPIFWIKKDAEFEAYQYDIGQAKTERHDGRCAYLWREASPRPCPAGSVVGGIVVG